MALLFVKRKLFPSWDSKKTAQPLREQYLKKPNLPASDLRCPLSPLDDEETSCLDGSTVDGGSDHNRDVDLEANMSSRYGTFEQYSPGAEGPERRPSSSSSNATGATVSTMRIDSRLIADAVLGMSDGLTVPFALSAGLSQFEDTNVVVLGGLAELVAGAISMGLGGYYGAKSEVESYDATVRAVNEVMSDPVKTRAVVQEIFTSYGLSEQGISDISDSLHRDEERLRNFVIKFHHKKDEPDCNQAWVSALTLGLSYFFGGFIPLMPYFITSDVRVAFNYSVAVMAVTLVVFGYVKTCSVRGFCGRDNIRAGLLGALQMCLIGGLAVGAAVGLVKLINRA